MSSTLQKLAGLFGVIFVVVAIVGFITPNGGMAMQPTDPATAAKALGMFPVNLLHNIVHLLFGIWGLAASRSWTGSKSFFTGAGVIYAILTVCGFLSPYSAHQCHALDKQEVFHRISLLRRIDSSRLRLRPFLSLRAGS